MHVFNINLIFRPLIRVQTYVKVYVYILFNKVYMHIHAIIKPYTMQNIIKLFAIGILLNTETHMHAGSASGHGEGSI